MSSELSGLLSATFWEAGYQHVVELVHQRGTGAHRHLASLDVAVYDAGGGCLGARAVDPQQETLALDALMAEIAGAPERAMVVFDARYDERIFPYRPHHYGFFHRPRSGAPPLYYAVNAVLGGVPDRIGATNLNNFETYLFRRHPAAPRYSVLVGNLSRFAPAEAEVFVYHGAARTARAVTLAPKAHVECPLPAGADGQPPSRVEVKALFRLATYIVGRHAAHGDLVLFDHLFTYFK